MGNRVSRQKTPVSEVELTNAVIQAWYKLFGTTPTKEQVSMVLAQNALETGNRNAMWNYNVGNLTTDGNGQYNYFDDLTTSEQVSPSHWQKMKLKYRAYDTLEGGMQDYLKFISSGRYSKAWEHILHPNPANFSKELKHAGYYTANEEPYTKGLTAYYNKFNKSNSYEQAQSAIPQEEDLENLINKYLTMMSAEASINYNTKKNYNKFLPNNYFVIKISSSDYLDGIEFSRILSTVLDEKLKSTSYTHTDGKNIEVESKIAGDIDNCFNCIKELVNITKEEFKKSTIKIGGIDINIDKIINKRSSYNPISGKHADINYRKFLLKF